MPDRTKPPGSSPIDASEKKIVSRVAIKTYVTWQHQPSVLSKSQGVLLMMRGTAECNACKTVGQEYPERHATCAHEVMRRRQAIQLCRNGCTLRTTPTMLCAWECGD